jgi:hypothetical protein
MTVARAKLWGAVLVGCLLAGTLFASQAARAAAPACTVTFTGKVSDDWSNPANWSTGKVPGPTSDVCVTKAALEEPTATGGVDIHSLQVGPGAFVDFGEITRATVTISDVLIDTRDSFVLIDGTLTARSIENPGALIEVGGGASTITSPALSSTGAIQVTSGTLRLTDNPLQLHNGTLTGGTLEFTGSQSGGSQSDAIIVNGDISSIAAGTINQVGGNIEDQSGGDALASLSSIGRGGTLIVGDLILNGNLVSRGRLEVEHSLGVDGDYTQTSTGTLAMGNFFLSGMNVGGTATFSGTLDIGFDTTCTPRHGTVSTLMVFAARSGMFTANSSSFKVLYGTDAVNARYVGPTNTTGCGLT